MLNVFDCFRLFQGRLSTYIHACLLVEDGDDKILLDPGKFSFIEESVTPDEFKDLSAVVLTHRHADHVNDEALGKTVANNLEAVVLTNAEIEAQLNPLGIVAEVIHEGFG